MRKRKPDPFKEKIDRILRSRGHSFQGIRLRCKNCGEEAFAKSPGIAEMFGWSDLVKHKGAQYEGICIDCEHPDSPPPTTQTERKTP